MKKLLLITAISVLLALPTLALASPDTRIPCEPPTDINPYSMESWNTLKRFMNQNGFLWVLLENPEPEAEVKHAIVVIWVPFRTLAMFCYYKDYQLHTYFSDKSTGSFRFLEKPEEDVLPELREMIDLFFGDSAPTIPTPSNL